jgi:hypothetical protein
MPRISLACLTTFALCALAFASKATPAQGSPPQGFTITTVVSYLPTESFTWSSTGAISDGGALEFTSAHWGGVPSPAVGALQLGMSLLGANGTIAIRANLVATATSTPGVFAFDGPFTVTGGTGAYANTRGTGTAHVLGRVDQRSTPDDPEIGVLEGRVRIE